MQPPPTADGLSLLPLLKGEKDTVRDALGFAYCDFDRAFKTDDAKLIEYYIKGQRHTQLYDMKADPWETKNLAEDPDAALLLKMRGRLEAWRKEQGDPLLDPNYKPKATVGQQEEGVPAGTGKKKKGQGNRKAGKKKAGARQAATTN